MSNAIVIVDNSTSEAFMFGTVLEAAPKISAIVAAGGEVTVAGAPVSTPPVPIASLGPLRRGECYAIRVNDPNFTPEHREELKQFCRKISQQYGVRFAVLDHSIELEPAS